MGVTWTEEQQKVISLRDRNILVSAAAGSGKTAVLVQRILSKIMDTERPVDIDRLLIMTFTRAAAGEMKERISAAIDQMLYDNPDNEHLQRQASLIHNAQITTIDGFCAYIIRNYFHMIDLDPGYRTAEEGELKLLREDVMKEVLEAAYARKGEKFLSLVECYATGKTDDEIRDMIYKLYDASMSHPFPEEWIEECLEVYQVDSLEDLHDTPWMKLIWDAADESIVQVRELLSRAAAICREESGPYFYEAALDDDILLLRAAETAVKERDYNGFSELLKNHKYARLSTKKDLSVDEEKKIQVKDLRDSAKGLWNELTEKYFNQTEELILEYLQYCRRPMEGLAEVTLQYKDAFADRKREQNILDFTDMEHFALDILMHKEGDTITPSAAAWELSARYDEVMVDEYQDSNLVQEMITNLVAGWADKRKNIFMVGDVKQSIYRFRLARPELFMEKYHRYSLEDSEEQRIDLHKNFRSREEVLTCTNDIFYKIMVRSLGNVEYDVNGYMAYNKNKVEKYPNPDKGDKIKMEGYAWDSFYGYECTGIFMSDEEAKNSPVHSAYVKAGDLKFKDQNNDGKIDAEDRVVLGNTIPNITYGFNLNMKYRDFDFLASFQGVADVYRTVDTEMMWGFVNGQNATERHLDRTIVENGRVTQLGHFPRILINQSHNRVMSSFLAMNASYLRLKNLQIGYNLPQSLLKSIHLNRARLYVSGQNLFTFTKFPNDFDPEVKSGSGGYSYPQVAIYSIGLDITF